MPRTKEKLAIDTARRMLHHGAYGRVANLLATLHDVEVADFLERLPLDDRRKLVGYVQTERLPRILAEMSGATIAETVETLDPKGLTRLIIELPREQAAGVLRALPDERREQVLQSMDEPLSLAVSELLSYEPGTVGAIMRPNPFALDENLQVIEAVEALRRVGDDAPLYAYVIDRRRHLVGVLSFRQLLIASPDRRLRQIMTPEPISTRPEDPQEEAAALVSRYDFVALPVVDENNRLLGVVSVDDILDMLQDRATEEMYKMAGLGSGDRVFSPAMRSVRMRLPWLVINLGTAIVAASVVAVFQNAIDRVVLLAVMMPIVAGMGGNAATQSLTVVIRGLALGELTLREGLRAAFKEGATSLLLGLMIGIIAGVLAWARYQDLALSLILGSALLVNMFIAGLAGVAVPLVLRAMRVDPALASGVMVTTITDCCGFGVFLGLATLLLGVLKGGPV